MIFPSVIEFRVEQYKCKNFEAVIFTLVWFLLTYLFSFRVLSYISVPALIIFNFPLDAISTGDLFPFVWFDMEEVLRLIPFPFLPVNISPMIKPMTKAIIAVHMVDAAKVSPVYNVIEFSVIAWFRYGENSKIEIKID